LGPLQPFSSPPFEHVIVSFYGRSQLSDIASALQTVSGLEVMFFTTSEHHRHFEGKVLDYEPERWFFLRVP